MKQHAPFYTRLFLLLIFFLCLPLNAVAQTAQITNVGSFPAGSPTWQECVPIPQIVNTIYRTDSGGQIPFIGNTNFAIWDGDISSSSAMACCTNILHFVVIGYTQVNVILPLSLTKTRPSVLVPFDDTTALFTGTAPHPVQSYPANFYPLPIPNDPNLIGTNLWAQGLTTYTNTQDGDKMLVSGEAVQIVIQP